MTPDHLAQVHRRAFTSHPRAWSAAEMAEFLDMPGCFVVGNLRSFVIGRVVLDEAEVLTVATDTDHLRQGLARAALAQFDAQAMARGATQAFLEVAEDNLAAQALYGSTGFEKVGRRPGYYAPITGPKIAALIMRKSFVV